jgi:hypothetical protein
MTNKMLCAKMMKCFAFFDFWSSSIKTRKKTQQLVKNNPNPLISYHRLRHLFHHNKKKCCVPESLFVLVVICLIFCCRSVLAEDLVFIVACSTRKFPPSCSNHISHQAKRNKKSKQNRKTKDEIINSFEAIEHV